MEVPHRITTHMIVGLALLAQVAGFVGLSRTLCSVPIKWVACSCVAACAVFQVSVIVNLISALGMPLFSAWLIGSTAQAGCLIAVLAKPDASKNQAVAVVCLIASNCMNIWFGIEFFDAALSGT